MDCFAEKDVYTQHTTIIQTLDGTQAPAAKEIVACFPILTSI